MDSWHPLLLLLDMLMKLHAAVLKLFGWKRVVLRQLHQLTHVVDATAAAAAVATETL
jgi:hypothetical protein